MMEFQIPSENYNFESCTHWCDLDSFLVNMACSDETGVVGDIN